MLRRLALAFSLITASAQFHSAVAEPFHEEAFVPIGGAQQWITIHSANIQNPVLLVLHGGPGDAISPYAESLFAGWDRDFTLVQWDQRGAGRTYGKSRPSPESTISVERMTKDGIEVAQYLTQHLGKRKIILIGGSWGSVLGFHMIHERPDLFHAFVGQSILVNFRNDLSASYDRVREMAGAANDQTTVTALESIGPPPWKTLFPQWRIYRKALMAYQAKLAKAPKVAMQIRQDYAGPAERKQYSEAEEFSMFNFWSGRQPTSKADLESLTLSGPLSLVDLPALATEFKIPIYLFEGEHDLTAPPSLVKAYFETIKAPRKEFYLVPGNGHEPSQTMMELTHKVLLEQVKPLTK
ncbi:MAG: alpha/beta hydrolase [Sphingobium sp.]